MTADNVGRAVLYSAIAALAVAGCESGKKKPAKDLKLGLPGGATMEFVLIPAGSYERGLPKREGILGLLPDHRATIAITKPFYLGVTEVTQAQWKAVMGTEPWKPLMSCKEGDNYAASTIYWKSATKFCEMMSSKSGRTVRLPTEAEWEYALRAGGEVPDWTQDERRLGDYAWYSTNTQNVGQWYAHEVARKKPNAWGLYDMRGNVWELCADWYDGHMAEHYYAGKDVEDPRGPPSGWRRLVRGGGWNDGAIWPGGYDSFVFRFGWDEGTTNNDVGFRIVVEVVSP